MWKSQEFDVEICVNFFAWFDSAFWDFNSVDRMTIRGSATHRIDYLRKLMLRNSTLLAKLNYTIKIYTYIVVIAQSFPCVRTNFSRSFFKFACVNGPELSLGYIGIPGQNKVSVAFGWGMTRKRYVEILSKATFRLNTPRPAQQGLTNSFPHHFWSYPDNQKTELDTIWIVIQIRSLFLFSCKRPSKRGTRRIELFSKLI
jgi:hypothetical protein